jgi:hypothetical protein
MCRVDEELDLSLLFLLHFLELLYYVSVVGCLTIHVVVRG